MSDYKVINDNGYERTWEELYEDNVRFQKYTDKLEKENKELKRNCNIGNENLNFYREENQELKKQQEEFINYMMNTIENITHDETDDEEIKGYLIQRGNTLKEILQKYKEIIGKENDSTK